MGLLGFAIMWIGILIVLWKVDPRFGGLALAVFLSRIVQSQFDLFWVAGQTSVPFVIAGICLGALALEQERAAPDRRRLQRATALSAVSGIRLAGRRSGRRNIPWIFGRYSPELANVTTWLGESWS